MDDSSSGGGSSSGGLPAWATALIFVAMIALGAMLGTVVYLAATGNMGMLVGKGPGKGLAEGKAVANPMTDVNAQGHSRVTV